MNNPLLSRQIRKYTGNLPSEYIEKLQVFFSAIEDAYEAFENDRSLMERSLEISSMELSDMNKQLTDQNHEKTEILSSLIHAIKTLELAQKKKEKYEDITPSELPKYFYTLIDEYVNSQKTIVQNLQYQDTILNSLNECICVISSSGKIVSMNTPWLRFFHGAEADIFGSHYKKIFSIQRPDDASWMLDTVMENFFKDETQEENIHIRDAEIILNNGEIIPISMNLVPVHFSFEKSQDQKWCILSFYDSSKEKESEKMKNDFVAVAWHELRTPMSVIIWYSHLLLDNKIGILTDEQRSVIQKISTNTQWLLYLVNDLLTISRIESKKMMVQLTEFWLDELICSVVDEFRSTTTTKGVEFFTHVSGCKIRSDAMKLRQVLTNLIGNAVKFTPNWSIDVSLEEDQDTVKIHVKDTGVGIPADAVEKLFGKFFQAHNYLKRKEESWTWLGLFICKNIVHLLGGSIWVKSEYSKGSTFSFSIPKIYVDAPNMTPTEDGGWEGVKPL